MAAAWARCGERGAAHRKLHCALAVRAAAVPAARVHVAVAKRVREHELAVGTDLAHDAPVGLCGEERALDDHDLALERVVHPLALVNLRRE